MHLHVEKGETDRAAGYIALDGKGTERWEADPNSAEVKLEDVDRDRKAGLARLEVDLRNDRGEPGRKVRGIFTPVDHDIDEDDEYLLRVQVDDRTGTFDVVAHELTHG